MNEHATNPRIIIDASYIRGASSDGAPFRTMCKQGGRIVLIDNLIYELCSTDDTNQWRASMNKLKAGVDAIEVWEHISPMYEVELKENRPYGDPLHDERTRRIREMIANNSQYQPANMKKLIKGAQQAREGDDILKLLHNVANCCPLDKKIAKKIKNKPGHNNKVGQLCYNFISNPDNIRPQLQYIVQNPNNVDETWVIWHVFKSLLPVHFDRQRRDTPFGKSLTNIKLDLDYLVSLAFADAIASGETKGEMSFYRRWMYGEAKPQLSSREPDKIARFMNKLSN